MAKQSATKKVIEITNKEERNEANALLVEIIVKMLEAREKQQNGKSPVEYDYILGQTIRQYKVSPDNWHITEDAAKLWGNITNDDISLFDYTQPINIDVKEDCSVQLYKANVPASEGETIYHAGYKGKINFNKLFIAEHTTPVSDVRDALITVYRDRENYDNLNHCITGILEKIHITRMLKGENKGIKSSGRLEPNDIIKKTSSEIFNTVWKECYKELKMQKQ